ncbi:MAG: CRISPR-associated ring nuclease Csm6, partial [Candidatus Competibacter sp.]|nr:CRISPR-associated ring nuclease Csm6 [Candidatus Competibacter sp.]
MNPESYPRRILLCVAGLSPQIVTETLYALTVTGEPRFVPTEIHLLTTAEGAERARLTLLGDEPGWFHRMRGDHGLPAIRFTLDTIHILRAADGRLLDDIREPADNEAIADAITAMVRELTADPDSAVHASIAGGRKTMGFYLGYALSLFGRPQDRLSHVLVSSPFESNPNFFYPAPVERVIFATGPDQRPLDASSATVTLAEIPFVRLRDGLQESLLRDGA